MIQDFFSDLIHLFLGLPDYVGKGIIDLFSAIIGGILVGWIGSTFFARNSQIAEIEGEILKKKVAIYEDLSSKLEFLRNAITLSAEAMTVMKDMFDKSGFKDIDLSRRYVLAIFSDPMKFTDSYLDLDKFFVSNRIFFDDNVLLSTMIFQNYMGAIRRIMTLYEEQIIDVGESIDNPNSKSIESSLLMELGVLIEKEFSEIIDEALDSIRLSLTGLNLSHHKPIPHNWAFYNGINSPIMNRLKDTILMNRIDRIKLLVANNISLGLLNLGR